MIALLTEYREVPVHKWQETYNYNDEQPQGLYIFKELVERYFKDIPSTLNGYPEDTLNLNSLYIQFVPGYLDSIEVATLLNTASEGNDVLIIADLFNNRIADTVSYFFEDTFQSDSILSFNFADLDIAADSPYVHQFLDQEFKPKNSIDFYLMEGFGLEEEQEYVRVSTPDGLVLMASFTIGKGRLFYHVKKDLFYNYSYRQAHMFEYTQKLFSYFEPQHIYLLNPVTLYSSGDSGKKNPLEFIMSQPALKAAYYLLILGTLLYVIFGGKRKQKIIPVTAKNKNTSLEYIDTVGQLFFHQGQHEKLVAHMRKIFHHKMSKKFYVKPNDPNYVKVLAKKSKISETELQYIMDRFKNLDDDFSFRGDQLVSLNRRLENIYKEIETK